MQQPPILAVGLADASLGYGRLAARDRGSASIRRCSSRSSGWMSFVQPSTSSASSGAPTSSRPPPVDVVDVAVRTAR